MTLTPLLNSPLEIQIHVVAALTSILLGPFIIFRQRRDRLHKALGYIWVSAMAVVALSSFLITEFALIGPLSPIHLLSVLTLGTLWVGVRYAISGNIAAHRAAFRNLYWFGLLIAGTFNFLPDRRMNQVFFGEAGHLGYVVMGASATIFALYFLRKRLILPVSG